MKRIGIVALLALCCASCIVQPLEYDVAGEETRVAAAVQATLAQPGGALPTAPATSPPWTPTAAPTPTTTLTPSPTAAPTPEPSPTQQVVPIPDDWVHYTAVTGGLDLWHPASWLEMEEAPDTASFISGTALYAIGVMDDFCDVEGADADEALACLYDFGDPYLAGDVELLGSQVRTVGTCVKYIAEFRTKAVPIGGHGYIITVSAGEGALLALFGYALGPQRFSDEDLADLDLVAMSAAVLEWPIDYWPSDGGPAMSDEGPQSDVDLVVTDWEWHTNDAGTVLSVQGTVENASTRRIQQVRIAIVAYDDEDRQISRSVVNVDVLWISPAGRAPFDAIIPVNRIPARVEIASVQGEWAG